MTVEVQLVKKETPKAFLLEIDGDDYWVPKSQIEEPDYLTEGECDLKVAMTEWIVQEKEIPFDEDQLFR